ncbi:sigma-70 family RNA polymerase sigma factor [Clostridium guangxiense]|uniref:sigma-70 family RNA polymerase sigma factor n=1 Tax=Clostridium guangxiense TaxID=1662055 RepID=UPI001E2AB9EF|nr:sigma-70 family RNA polymerase sigma factor [Clostridium guangxiense]MCD2345133.1 sigma-70 family RNA polymerase sigma factor [Clostridium guangxiense]
MSSRIKDKKIENIVSMYYADMQNAEAYESKVRYYNENKHRMKRDFTKEIQDIKEIVSEIRFKNKHLEEIINSLAPEEKKYVELKYKCKFSVTQIEDKMYIKDRSYYRIRKKILNHLDSALYLN